MKYKSYALLLLLSIVVFFVVKNNSQQSLVASEKNTIVEEKNNLTIKTIHENPTEKATKTTTEQASIEPATPDTTIEMQPSSTSEPEPTTHNSDMTATGEFADEVNLQNSENNCEESCDGENTEIAGSKNVNTNDTGEHADQINKEAIFAQAKQKNTALQPEIKLADPSEGAPPTTEIGVYTPPPQ